MDNMILKFTYDNNGTRHVYPANKLIEHWKFSDDEKDEATLANSIANLFEKVSKQSNKELSPDDIMYSFKYLLRILKSDSNWAK